MQRAGIETDYSEGNPRETAKRRFDMSLALVRSMTVAICALLSVAAHGGDSGHGASAGTSVSYGPVTDFGSVWVNGVEFATTNSSVTVDNSAMPDDAHDAGPDHHRGLKRGMVVRVEGSFDSDGVTGTATRVTYRSNLMGPITKISAHASGRVLTLVAAGQTVLIDSQTWVATPTMADMQGVAAAAGALATGNVVAVSGLPEATGAIRATRVEKTSDTLAAYVAYGGEIEAKGTIRNIGAASFNIGNLTVRYAAGTTALPTEGLRDGQPVEAKGASFDASTNTLVATRITPDADTLGVTDAGKVEIEGFVSAVTSRDIGVLFTVGTQPVKTTPSTNFEPAGGEIITGARLEVEGVLTGGTLTATKISFK
ncbi:MAG: hypothetical protein A2151_06725 [Candidatus Muproteobacteria bacterium RBG_16_65_34]|uniref:DUF5666 domain-containing protein n=1 Tax=Candidatus Muproteobacteria bacterium RBG_16_65_34 TaxID=1817760 RepID=A0A1F6TVQ8_9PROT|nr:MAG: hypothetical protein A2151_06725 [Candidatus Muproteobacteria bacterium RBG_16_65_34]